MWTSCESYIKSVLFVLICCLGPILCMATFGLAMQTTAPYLFIYLFIYLFYLSFHSYFDIQIQFPKFPFSHLFIQSLLFSLLLLFYLLIYLFIFKIPSLNISSKFRFPNLIPRFQNSNFHIYLFNHYIFVIINTLFIYLFISFQNYFFK